ncbi:hypothetical protein ACFSTC_39565 [Nonomuraea ferruginea]
MLLGRAGDLEEHRLGRQRPGPGGRHRDPAHQRVEQPGQPGLVPHEGQPHGPADGRLLPAAERLLRLVRDLVGLDRRDASRGRLQSRPGELRVAGQAAEPGGQAGRRRHVRPHRLPEQRPPLHVPAEQHVQLRDRDRPALPGEPGAHLGVHAGQPRRHHDHDGVVRPPPVLQEAPDQLAGWRDQHLPGRLAERVPDRQRDAVAVRDRRAAQPDEPDAQPGGVRPVGGVVRGAGEQVEKALREGGEVHADRPCRRRVRRCKI